MRFPKLPVADRIRQSTQTVFGGLNHTAGASDGDLYDMQNLWSGDFPRLSVRPKRVILDTLDEPIDLYGTGDHRVTVFTDDGSPCMTIDDAVVSWLSDDGKPKVFSAIGDRILVWPDKIICTWGWSQWGQYEWEANNLEASETQYCIFIDGTYAGEPAAGNTIQAASSSVDWSQYFRVGDAVTISGSNQDENNKTLIIREISGNELRFYENSFTTTTTAEYITITRAVPDLDYICVNENRVWGCKGDTIYASKLGDPYNWNVFDGLSTDSWSWDTGTAGDFTGCVSFMGYPCFFKENQIFKIYGDKPTNFQAMGSPDLGVMSGCGRSLAIANETLFYLSRVGVMAYTGGKPQIVSTELGVKLHNAVSGSDGLKYYMSAQDYYNNTWRLYVYDALRQMWHVEDSTHALGFAPGAAGTVECLNTLGALWTTDTGATGTAEAAVSWSAELGDYYSQHTQNNSSRSSPNKKHITKLLLRLELPTGSTAAVKIKYDSKDDWVSVANLTAEAKHSEYLAVVPRRCDHFRLKLTGTGPCILHSLTVETAEGSPNKL